MSLKKRIEESNNVDKTMKQTPDCSINYHKINIEKKKTKQTNAYHFFFDLQHFVSYSWSTFPVNKAIQINTVRITVINKMVGNGKHFMQLN